ncbi:MAG: hypothetical protein H6P99_146 [Holophagaceae bacterium]|nr:hypothetical protein [Holophagaceae bacterium]
MIRIRVPAGVFQALLQRDWRTPFTETQAPSAFQDQVAGPVREPFQIREAPCAE